MLMLCFDASDVVLERKRNISKIVYIFHSLVTCRSNSIVGQGMDGPITYLDNEYVHAVA
jgi:hypothetical protein